MEGGTPFGRDPELVVPGKRGCVAMELIASLAEPPGLRSHGTRATYCIEQRVSDFRQLPGVPKSQSGTGIFGYLICTAARRRPMRSSSSSIQYFGMTSRRFSPCSGSFA